MLDTFCVNISALRSLLSLRVICSRGLISNSFVLSTIFKTLMLFDICVIGNNSLVESESSEGEVLDSSDGDPL